MRIYTYSFISTLWISLSVNVSFDSRAVALTQQALVRANVSSSAWLCVPRDGYSEVSPPDAL